MEGMSLWPSAGQTYETVTSVTNEILLTNNAVISGIFIAVKTLAISFVLLTWLKEYLQGIDKTGQKLPISFYSIGKGIACILLIAQFNVVTDLLDKGLGAYESSFNIEASDNMYSIGESWMDEYDENIIEEEEQKGFLGRAWDGIQNGVSFLKNAVDIWYWILQIVKFIAWGVNMMVYPIFLLERGFLLLIMKIALPLILALWMIPAYKQIVAKWVMLYCAIFITGLFFILATQFCDAAYAMLAQQDNVSWAFEFYQNAGKTATFLIIAFAKVKLYKGAVDLSYKIFNA